MQTVVGKRLRAIVDIDGLHFGFTKGNGTTYATWIVRQIQEKMPRKCPESDISVPKEDSGPRTNCEKLVEEKYN